MRVLHERPAPKGHGQEDMIVLKFFHVKPNAAPTICVGMLFPIVPFITLGWTVVRGVFYTG